MGIKNSISPSMHDVKAHVVRYGDCHMILWIDRGRQMQGMLHDSGMARDTARALARWSTYLEPRWRQFAD